MQGSPFPYQTKAGKRWGYVHDLPPRPGKPRPQKKRRGFPTKAAALDAMRRSILEQQNGAPVDPAHCTVGEYWEAYVAAGEGSGSPATWANYAWAWAHLEPHLGAVALADLGPPHLDQVCQALRRGGLGENSQHAVVKHLRTVLGVLIRRGQLHPGVWEGVRRPRWTDRAHRVLTSAEIATLLERLPGSRFEAPFLVALTTGVRLGELLALTWAVWDGAALTVQAHTSKSRRVRVVSCYPRTAAALDALQRHQGAAQRSQPAGWNPGGLLFPHHQHGTQHTANLWSGMWRHWVALHAADLDPFRWHDLRHTHASQLLDAGVPLPVVARRLGHASPQVTARIYSHMLPDTMDAHLARAAAAFDDAQSSAAGPAIIHLEARRRER